MAARDAGRESHLQDLAKTMKKLPSIIASRTAIIALASLCSFTSCQSLEEDRQFEEESIRSQIEADLIALYSALDDYCINNGGHYPETLEPLYTPDVNGYTYLRKRGAPLDPWSVEYQMTPATKNTRPVVFTLGADGVEGGTGIDADVTKASRSDN